MRKEISLYTRAADKFKALAHPARLRLVARLMEEECCVGDIQECLCLSQPNVSQHLKVLREAGIIQGKRDKNRICYRMADKAITEAIEIILKGENSNG
jgi:DNA-binding transcriptional ArsR family regulator